MRDPVALCADAVAGWHTAWLTSLGLRSAVDAGAWRALDRPPHIYFSAITLRPDTPAEAVADSAGAVCDSWQTLDLEQSGFRDWRREPWFLCAGPPAVAETPVELEIVQVATAEGVQEFEASACAGSRTKRRRSSPARFIRRRSSPSRAWCFGSGASRASLSARR